MGVPEEDLFSKCLEPKPQEKRTPPLVFSLKLFNGAPQHQVCKARHDHLHPERLSLQTGKSCIVKSHSWVEQTCLNAGNTSLTQVP